ncbi:hypothetical protein FDECE_2796 [Fusarium decemcellulare]|nr:hypothetical protein FDECE_2796 [Fusarium decemcellulare]
MPHIKLPDKTLFYTRTEPESPPASSHPVLLFIHGLGSSHSFYTPVMRHLATAGYSSIAFDVYGSGLSELSSGTEAPTFSSIARDAENLLSELSIPKENVVAVGHSMGGIVVAKLAASCNLRGAGLIGPVLPKPGLADIFSARIKTVKERPFNHTPKLYIQVLTSSEDGMEAMANAIPFAATGSKSTLTQKAFIRALLLSQKTDGYTALCDAIAKAERPVYADAHCPLLIIAGEEDKTSPVPDSETILKSWGSDDATKSIRVLPGVGHWHCIEAADEVGSALEQFLVQAQ